MPDVPLEPLSSPRNSRRVLQIKHVDLPVPVRLNSGVVRDELFQLFAGMKVRQCVELNRKKRSVELYVYAFRKQYGRERNFTVRALATGASRVWRTA